MVHKRGNLHVLKRPKIRQSWNKYNLYNLSRLQTRVDPRKTYFQQKWMAKSMTRRYHGETLLEKHWTRMFNPTMRSVISMNPRVLAQGDGSREASGTGSGLEVDGDDARSKRTNTRKRVIPYMNMVFAGMERRLDTAIFRAMFASSTRQARQFCVHGYVKVNGKDMPYPAYQLNPGDMFQVDPERVMYATGAPKDPKQRREGRVRRRTTKSADAQESKEAGKRASPAASAINQPLDPKSTLQSLLSHAKSILRTDASASASRKRDLRDFKRLVQRTLSKPLSNNSSHVDEQIAELTAKLSLSADTPVSPDDSAAVSTPGQSITITNDEKRRLAQALAEAQENPIDPTKPYATPWRPRDWMSPFAFIPRYLEVHHPICSAVYLRHPVARQQLAEVPTPFGEEVNGLAFNWYLRRR